MIFKELHLTSFTKPSFRRAKAMQKSREVVTNTKKWTKLSMPDLSVWESCQLLLLSISHRSVRSELYWYVLESSINRLPLYKFRERKLETRKNDYIWFRSRRSLDLAVRWKWFIVCKGGFMSRNIFFFHLPWKKSGTPFTTGCALEVFN